MLSMSINWSGAGQKSELSCEFAQDINCGSLWCLCAGATKFHQCGALFVAERTPCTIDAEQEAPSDGLSTKHPNHRFGSHVIGRRRINRRDRFRTWGIMKHPSNFVPLVVSGGGRCGDDRDQYKSLHGRDMSLGGRNRKLPSLNARPRKPRGDLLAPMAQLSRPTLSLGGAGAFSSMGQACRTK